VDGIHLLEPPLYVVRHPFTWTTGRNAWPGCDESEFGDSEPTAQASVADAAASPSSRNGANGAFALAIVKPDAQPRDGLAMASAVRFALAPAATAGPGTVRHPVVAAPAGGTVNAVTPAAIAVAATPTLMVVSHDR